MLFSISITVCWQLSFFSCALGLSCFIVQALIVRRLNMGTACIFFKRQALISLASVFVMLVVAKINYHWYAKRSKILYIVAFVLMALVLTPLGIEVYGARRWIRLPLGQQMQLQK